jgi:hypothetical protein
MPRTLEQIHRESPDSPALRGLVGVINEKLQLRARYSLLEYEAGMEGRPECSELYRLMSRIESEQIARLSAALAIELQSENPRPHADLRTDPDR